MELITGFEPVTSSLPNGLIYFYDFSRLFYNPVFMRVFGFLLFITNDNL